VSCELAGCELFLFGAEFAEDSDGGGGADAIGAGFKQGADLCDSADASGGLDAAARADYAAHERDIGGGSASRCKAGSGVDEIRASLNGDFGGAESLLHGEQAGFEIDFECRAMMVRDDCDRTNGMVDGLVIAALHGSDGKNHSELASAETDESRGFMKQRGNQRCAERKTYC
jgi:hypothetical protein